MNALTRALLVVAITSGMVLQTAPVEGKGCKDVPKGGWICPESLPKVPEYQLLCKKGCYLTNPEDSKKAKVDGQLAGLSEERKGLIESLQLHIKDLQLSAETLKGLNTEFKDQRDLFKMDVATLQASVDERDSHIDLLEERLKNSYDFWDMVGAFGIGAGVVVVGGLTVIGYIAIKDLIKND